MADKTIRLDKVTGSDFVSIATVRLQVYRLHAVQVLSKP